MIPMCLSWINIKCKTHVFPQSMSNLYRISGNPLHCCRQPTKTIGLVVEKTFFGFWSVFALLAYSHISLETASWQKCWCTLRTHQDGKWPFYSAPPSRPHMAAIQPIWWLVMIRGGFFTTNMVSFICAGLTWAELTFLSTFNLLASELCKQHCILTDCLGGLT